MSEKNGTWQLFFILGWYYITCEEFHLLNYLLYLICQDKSPRECKIYILRFFHFWLFWCAVFFPQLENFWYAFIVRLRYQQYKQGILDSPSFYEWCDHCTAAPQTFSKENQCFWALLTVYKIKELYWWLNFMPTWKS